MKISIAFKSTALLLIGFAAGLLASRIPHANAAIESSATDLADRPFMVYIDEVRQNFVFGAEFSGHYTQTVTLSDGSTRRIELTPMVHDGKQLIELRDTGHLSYMGLNGTTTNGTLMVQVRDVITLRELLEAEGWPL